MCGVTNSAINHSTDLWEILMFVLILLMIFLIGKYVYAQYKKAE